MTEDELRYYLDSPIRYLELLLIASNRAGKFKVYGINEAAQRAFQKMADDFGLGPSIQRFLLEQGHVRKRKYRVADLRKFPDYGRLIGFQDQRRYRPDKVIAFTIPHGWIDHYCLHESPVLPPGADWKLPGNTLYVLDFDRPIPEVVREAVEQALYWQIKSFTLVR